jgi:EpsD family peptidyl-prolyl cis-trans isomerase
MNQPNKWMLVLMVVSSLALAACGEKKPVGKNDSQVALKVNGEEITVAALNDRTGHIDNNQKYAISGPLMKLVISTELLRQAALQSKLDADPIVRAKIANSTQKILATAFLQKQVAAVGKPSDDEIRAYFIQHPERYAQRMQFSLQQLTIQPPPGKEVDIQAHAESSTNFADFEQWLAKNDIPHTTNAVSSTVDQLPEEEFQKLSKVPVGRSLVLGSKGQVNVIFVLAKESKPLMLEEATRQIAYTLMTKRQTEIVDGTLKQLRDKAKIEYMPPYTENGLPTAED